jgi:hypothetical protein
VALLRPRDPQVERLPARLTLEEQAA